MSVLICAATATEATACRRGVHDAGLEREFEVLRTGMGLENARRALKTFLKVNPRPGLIVSSGFAGAFSESIALHDWVTACNVYLMEQKLSRPRELRAFEGALNTTLVSSAELVVDHADRMACYEEIEPPISVDMESAAIAEVASSQAIPCMVLRMVTDTPKMPLPKFLLMMASAGNAGPLARRAVLVLGGLGGALVEPRAVARLVKEGAGWGRLLRLGWSERAAAVLGVANNSI